MVGPTLNTHHHLPLKPPTATIKFLCSYGGKILPRYPDGKLRYQGGQTRVLAVGRFISFAELLVKLGELCGTSVVLRCQLPTEDLDALVSITSDEDLSNLIEEYDHRSASSLKIRAFLSLPKSAKKASPSPSSTASSSSTTSTATLDAASPLSSSTFSAVTGGGPSKSRFPITATNRRIHQISKKPVKFPMSYEKSAGKFPSYAHGTHSRIYLIHNGNHWQ